MMLKKYFQLDVRIIVAVIIAIELIYTFLLNKFVLTDQFFYNSLIYELSAEQIEEMTKMARSFSWTTFVWAPFNVLLQMFLIALCVNVGALLLRYHLSFKAIFDVVAKSSMVFALSKIAIVVILLARGVKDIEDVNLLPRLSLFDLMNPATLPEWAIYPLQLINLYALMFVVLLAFGLNQIQEKGVQRWIPFVLSTYGTGLVIWAIFATLLLFL